MPVRTYTNWNKRSSDSEPKIEPFRKYYFICEGANTETFYFEKLIDLRKQLNIHPLIDIRFLEKTEEHKNMSYAKNLADFAEKQKKQLADFDEERDKMVIVFDGDIFESKVAGYDELITEIERNNSIAGVTNPGFELFLLLHFKDSYADYIENHERDFLAANAKGKYLYAYDKLLEKTGINAKTNKRIGELAQNILVAIEQEKQINQDVHKVKGRVSSNIASIIETIINEEPEL